MMVYKCPYDPQKNQTVILFSYLFSILIQLVTSQKLLIHIPYELVCHGYNLSTIALQKNVELSLNCKDIWSNL